MFPGACARRQCETSAAGYHASRLLDAAPPAEPGPGRGSRLYPAGPRPFLKYVGAPARLRTWHSLPAARRTRSLRGRGPGSGGVI